MKTTFKIATVSDLSTLVEFMREYYEYDHLAFDESIAHKVLEEILQDNSLGNVWLIHQGDEAVGYVALTLDYSLEFHGHNAFIDELYIREKYRGCGIGTSTLQFMEKVCRDLGIKALHLEVEYQNTKAKSFYDKSGFEAHERYFMTKWIY
ncbi:MAG: GNAT family N-acetyltransferase [Symploca sp. SIO2B6]|nr:GNAT family N-acetyltransferase [Symploca sp. SIO2B6]